MSTLPWVAVSGPSASQAQSNSQTNALFGSTSSQQTMNPMSGFAGLSPPSIGTGTLVSPYADLASSTSDKIEFLAGFAKLFNSQVHSDVTLYLGPSKFKFHAHHVILSLRTGYFDFQPNNQPYFMREEGLHALYRMLEYIYKGDYATDSPSLDGTKDDPDLLKHTRVFLLDDQIGVKGLKELCAQKFAKQAIWLWTTDQFIESIREVYWVPKSSGQCMRKEIYTVVQAHIEQLHENEKFRELLTECGEFAADVVDMVLEKYAPEVE
ncbi:hypothetical protein FQN51_003826 [Onygenales sp. PD_10]|nr:hypothetical protein FQN51_003826 [Onygenales sp. PD_10]